MEFKMQKVPYESAKMEALYFWSSDILTTSGEGTEDDSEENVDRDQGVWVNYLGLEKQQ